MQNQIFFFSIITHHMWERSDPNWGLSMVLTIENALLFYKDKQKILKQDDGRSINIIKSIY